MPERLSDHDDPGRTALIDLNPTISSEETSVSAGSRPQAFRCNGIWHLHNGSIEIRGENFLADMSADGTVTVSGAILHTLDVGKNGLVDRPVADRRYRLNVLEILAAKNEEIARFIAKLKPHIAIMDQYRRNRANMSEALEPSVPAAMPEGDAGSDGDIE